MPDAPFSVRLKAFRLSLGMTQNELAGTSRSCRSVNSVPRAVHFQSEVGDPREAGEGPWFRAGLRLIQPLHLTAVAFLFYRVHPLKRYLATKRLSPGGKRLASELLAKLEKPE